MPQAPHEARQGSRSVARAVAWTTTALALVYGVSALHYYRTQRHAFDPYTQMPSTRIPDIHAVKSPHEIRILALGGSTTESRDLPEELRYPSLVRRKLAAVYPDLEIQIFNAGRDWLNTRHNLIQFETYYQDWRPDIVLLLEGINDLYVSFSPLGFALGGYDPLYSHFYGAAAPAALPSTFEQHLYQLWRGPLTTELWYEAPFLRRTEIDYPIDRYLSLTSFESNLEKLVRSVRNAGAMPVLITQPSLYKGEMSPQERDSLWFGRTFCATRTDFARYEYPSPGSLQRALAAFNSAMRGIAQRERVALIDGDAALPKTLRIFEDDCHYTAAGAASLAAAVSDGIVGAELLAVTNARRR